MCGIKPCTSCAAKSRRTSNANTMKFKKAFSNQNLMDAAAAGLGYAAADIVGSFIPTSITGNATIDKYAPTAIKIGVGGVLMANRSRSTKAFGTGMAANGVVDLVGPLVAGIGSGSAAVTGGRTITMGGNRFGRISA